ncbi:hypothetical protein GC173_04985 [bacterium]|nr:hypothetical protein [bacterium]
MTELLIQLHAGVGDTPFILLSLIVMVILCFLAIPYSTDWMTNSAAGLAGKYFGPRSRSLVINGSTNNPEAASMAVGMAMGRVGGIANPLGSLFANIYLMFLIAPVVVLLKFLVVGRFRDCLILLRLMRYEWKLMLFHLLASAVTFVFGYIAMMLMLSKGQDQPPQLSNMILLMGGVLAIGIIVFLLVDAWLKRRRPELFDDMSDDDHNESWLQFGAGTLGVIASTFLLNAFFLAWTDVYTATLEGVFGVLIFVWLHWFVGALVTSLPELLVAIKYFEKLTAPDLNVALGSVSYSNFVNLVIGLLGVTAWYGMAYAGVHLDW